MSSLALCALHGMGAAQHLLPLAEALVSRGHDLVVLSAPEARGLYAHLDADFVPVPEQPMPDLDQRLPPLLRRPAQVHRRVHAMMIDSMPEQWAALQRAVRDRAVDVALGDGLFFGLSLLTQLPAGSRPAIVGIGPFPPVLSDPLVAPYGLGTAPVHDGVGRARTTALAFAASRSFAALSRDYRVIAERLTGRPWTGDIRDAYARAEVWAQCAVPRFEYPRTALPGNFRFVGPLAAPREDQDLPAWWHPVTEPRVVVVGTDQTSTAADLVIPTIRALRDDEVTVLVVGVTRREIAAAMAESIPSNVHFEQSAPWSRLIARRTVLVSTGDYVQVQHALRRGIPVVAAGTFEPHVETAARIAWAGVGVDLRVRSPAIDVLREAITSVMHDQGMRRQAAQIAAQIAATDAERAIAELVEQLVPARA